VLPVPLEPNAETTTDRLELTPPEMLDNLTVLLVFVKIVR
jgi:hypothetical protein